MPRFTVRPNIRKVAQLADAASYVLKSTYDAFVEHVASALLALQEEQAAQATALQGKLDQAAGDARYLQLSGGALTGQTIHNHTGSATNDSTQSAILVKPSAAPGANYQAIRVEPYDSTTSVFDVNNLGVIRQSATHTGVNAAYVGASFALAASNSLNGISYAVYGTVAGTGNGGGCGIAGDALVNAGGRSMVGVRGTASSQNGGTSTSRNVGVVGYAVGNGSAIGSGCGVYGVSSMNHVNSVGGFFTLGGLLANHPDAMTGGRCALVADNRSEEAAIFDARDNGVSVFKIADGGLVTATGRIYSAADFVSDAADKGIILKSPDAHYWRLTIDNSGTLSTTDLGTTLPA